MSLTRKKQKDKDMKKIHLGNGHYWVIFLKEQKTVEGD